MAATINKSSSCSNKVASWQQQTQHCRQTTTNRSSEIFFPCALAIPELSNCFLSMDQTRQVCFHGTEHFRLARSLFLFSSKMSTRFRSRVDALTLLRARTFYRAARQRCNFVFETRENRSFRRMNHDKRAIACRKAKGRPRPHLTCRR